MPAGMTHAPRTTHRSLVVETYVAKKAETPDESLSVSSRGSAVAVASGSARVKSYPDPEMLEFRDLRVPVEGPGLDHPAYNVRMKLHGYNCKVNCQMAASVRDAANILIWANPQWTRADHARLAVEHAKAADDHEAAWGKIADAAARETFGTDLLFHHYRVSGIGCAEFPDDVKDALRHHAHARPKHRLLSMAHDLASTSRRLRD